MKRILPLLCLLTFHLSAYNQAGTLDLSFGNQGIVRTDFGGEAVFYASAIQADGKIVVAGSINTVEPYYAPHYMYYVIKMNMLVCRFQPDGKIDSSFSEDGKQEIVFNINTLSAKDVAIQPDGKIIVVGTTLNINNFHWDFAIARFNPDGTYDNSFSEDGKLIIDFGYFEIAHKVCLQADGKTIIAGLGMATLYDNDFVISRSNTDGTLDSSFSEDGGLFVDLGSVNDQAFAVVVQPDQKILLAGVYGTGEYETNYMSDFALIRLNSDGTPDKGFGVNGQVITDFKGGSDVIFDAILQPDGKIIVAGGVHSVEPWPDEPFPRPDDPGFAVVRYNSDGSLDNSFSNDGKLMLDLRSNGSAATSLALQQDQKILVAGFTNGEVDSHNYTDPGDFAMVRINPDGTLDQTFASNGIMVQDLGGSEGIESINIWQNRIYAVGRTTYPGTAGIIAAYLTGELNKLPIANPWLQKYYSPTSVLLSAWGSYDPDGPSIKYLWQKVAAPVGDASILMHWNSASPVITGLTNGLYTYRLTVTDNKGATDTADVTFTVKTNLPPVANGWLMKYYSPTSVLFNAWGSYDPEGGKLTYWWEKIDGPAQYTMWYRNATTPVIFDMVPGTYKFQLTVTDPEGATGKDTVTLTINPPITSSGRGSDLTANENGISTGQLHIYPNPVKEILNIRWLNEYTGAATLTVTDMSGKQVKVMKVNKTTADYNNKIELGGLKPGLYTLFISHSQGKTFSTSFMKQ